MLSRLLRTLNRTHCRYVLCSHARPHLTVITVCNQALQRCCGTIRLRKGTDPSIKTVPRFSTDMLRYALSLVILRVGTVRGCLGCVPGDRPAHIAKNYASGSLYVEWDTHDCNSRTSYATGATVDFSVGMLSKTEETWEVTDGLSFGAETKPPVCVLGIPNRERSQSLNPRARRAANHEGLRRVARSILVLAQALDADQPEGGGYVSIDGVQYTMPGMISAWSAYRSYKWSWWYSQKLHRSFYRLPRPSVAFSLLPRPSTRYSEKLGRFYFIYLADADDHSGEKEEMRVANADETKGGRTNCLAVRLGPRGRPPRSLAPPLSEQQGSQDRAHARHPPGHLRR